MRSVSFAVALVFIFTGFILIVLVPSLQIYHEKDIANIVSGRVFKETAGSKNDKPNTDWEMTGIIKPMCFHVKKNSDRARSWDWRKEIGIDSFIDGQKGPAISFRELIMALVPAEKRTKTAVNVGARDGIDHDPVYPLLRDLEYGAIVFEGDDTVLETLKGNMAGVNASQSVHVIPTFVSSASIVAYLKRFNVNNDFDALKIDIDSIDMSIAKAILGAGYRPKFIMMEINPDISPPFQFYLEESSAFTFEYAKTVKGMYGVSGDALLHYLVPLGYRLLELELVDATSSCQRCEHNMWFVHEDVINTRTSVPPAPSYDEYVSIFWSRGPICVHIEDEFCPVFQVQKLFPNTSADVASMQLLAPSRRAMAYRILGTLALGMESLCPNCDMHLQLSQVSHCVVESHR